MSAIGFSISELEAPASLDHEGSDRFRELVEVRNRVDIDTLGTDALTFAAAELLPMFRDNPHRFRRHFVATLDGAIVGRALLGWLPQKDAPAASLTIDVLPEVRGRGIGGELLAVLEERAVQLGRRTLQASVAHRSIPGGERLAPPTGFGDISADDPGARFLMGQGYALEQVARISALDLAQASAVIDEQRRRSSDHAGPDYRPHTWSGPAPETWLDDLATLKTAMSVEDPSAGLDVVEDRWDAARVRDEEARHEESGRLDIVAAIEHVPNGRLAGYTEISAAPDGRRAAQEDTLVLPDHRGHRLGMLLKAVNAQQLAQVVPGVLEVTTFNAEDNRPMLDVNEALGFRAIGHEGEWQKRV